MHGSPRRINEFLSSSTSPAAFLEVLLDQERCDGMLCTHTGLHWHRRLPSGRDVVNVGVIGFGVSIIVGVPDGVVGAPKGVMTGEEKV